MTVASNSSFATYSSVMPQSPALSVSLNGGGLVLQWPASGVGFALYTATNLAPAANWLLATNQAAIVNGRWQILLTNDPIASRFYRLQAE